MSAPRLKITATRILRAAIADGRYCVAVGAFRRPQGERWQGYGHREARAVATLESLGLVTATREREHIFTFRGTNIAMRPTLAAYTVAAMLDDH